jgi:hypothetical protein
MPFSLFVMIFLLYIYFIFYFFLQVNLQYMVSQVGAMAVEDQTNPVCIPTLRSTETGLIIGWRIPCQVARRKLPQQVRMNQSIFSHGFHQTAWSFITTTKQLCVLLF